MFNYKSAISNIKFTKFITLLSFLSALIISSAPPLYADIDETEISGLYEIFKDEYKHLSPINGLLTINSNLLANVRLHGNYGKENKEFLCHKQITHPNENLLPSSDKDCPQDNTTAIIQHLFPSPAGGTLAISNAPSDFFNNISIEHIGRLLRAYTGFKSNKKNQKDIPNTLTFIKRKLSAKALSDIAFGWQHMAIKGAVEKLVEHLSQMLIGASYETHKYPHALVESALLALAIKKANNVSDLQPLLEQLKDFQNPSQALTLRAQSFSFATYLEFKKSMLNHQIPEDVFNLLLFKDPEALIFNTLAYHKYDIPYPAMLGTGRATFREKDFSDCGESSLRNFFNLILSSGSSRSFNTDHLIKTFPNVSKALLDFYVYQQPSYDKVTSDRMRDLWAEVVSDLDLVQEPKIHYSRLGDIAGIGVDNILAVIEILLQDQELAAIRIANKEDDNKRRRDTFNYLFSKLSRDNFKLDWRTTRRTQEIDQQYFDMIIYINGESKYVWHFKPGHFQLSPITSPSMVSTDWRRNQAKILGWLVNAPPQYEMLKNALAPFYLPPEPSALSVLSKLHTNEKNLMGTVVLYSGNLAGSEQKLDTLNMAAELGVDIRGLAARWLESIPDDGQLNRKVVMTVYNLERYVAGWKEYFTNDNFPKTYSLYEREMKAIFDATTYEESQISDYFNYHFSTAFLLDVTGKFSAEKLIPDHRYELDNLLHYSARTEKLELVKLLIAKVPELATEGGCQDKYPLEITNQVDIAAIITEAMSRRSLKYCENKIYKKEIKDIIAKELAKTNRPIDMIKDKSGQTELHREAKLGNLDQVSLLLSEAPLLASDEKIAVDMRGNTALHYAAQNGHTEVVSLLLSEAPLLAGDEKLAKEQGGFNPLHMAAYFGHIETIKLLLSKAPHFASNENFAKNTAGAIPLHYAAQNGFLEAARLIAEATPRALLEPSKNIIYSQELNDLIKTELSKEDRAVDKTE